ncbi:hypothetical protein [Pyramidobacter piscolens]|uniref:hypothetical protein n=1 Tax=Pyramidobacter piscolens TaxID=638849 RepID=UPI0028E5B5DD|nr:hypothetical protein [Pyramidobacter piscolens]
MSGTDVHSLPERLRQRIRRLTVSRERLGARSLEQKRRLDELTAQTASALAMLNIYSGPQSAELFRLSFVPIAVESGKEIRSGVECLQFHRADANARHGLLPRYTSLLTSPQAEKASLQVEELIRALWDYINGMMELRSADCLIRRLRRSLKQAERERLQAAQAFAARRAAREHVFETERHRRKVSEGR